MIERTTQGFRLKKAEVTFHEDFISQHGSNGLPEACLNMLVLSVMGRFLEVFILTPPTCVGICPP